MSPVMVTTRPWKAANIRWEEKIRKAYTMVRLDGFSRRNLSNYIRKYFKDDDVKGEQLVQFMEENDVISDDMACCPIYAALFCLMWREGDNKQCKNIQRMQTFSQVFKEVIFFLSEHYALKKCKDLSAISINVLLKKVNDHLMTISEIALRGLMENNLTFNEEHFKSCPEARETTLRVGILTEEKSIISRDRRHDPSQKRLETTITFPHKLFQEFMAGKYLASLIMSGDTDKYSTLIDQQVLPRKNELKHLLYFTASQNTDVGTDIITRLMMNSHNEPLTHLNQKATDFIVDVAFECHDKEVGSVVKANVLQPITKFTVTKEKSAHTLAGYMFLISELVSNTGIGIRRFWLYGI